MTDSAAAESEQASGELKTENVRLTGGTALKSLNVKDVKCSFGGELLTAGMNSSSLTEVNIADAVIERSGSSKSQPALAIGGSKCIGTVTDSVISNDCGAGISISGSGGVWTLQDCDISASADAVLMSGNSSSIEIDGGRYTSETNAISTGSYSGNKAILKDGVFTGALYVGRASGSAIEIREGYYKGNFAGTGSANYGASQHRF